MHRENISAGGLEAGACFAVSVDMSGACPEAQEITSLPQTAPGN
jgi:hypothetical protein